MAVKLEPVPSSVCQPLRSLVLLVSMALGVKTKHCAQCTQSWDPRLTQTQLV